MNYAEMLVWMLVVESHCLKATQPKERKQRGATKATLARRSKLFGTCPDCTMPKRICREVGGGQP